MIGLQRDEQRIAAVTVVDAEGTHQLAADHYVSSMPITALIHQIDPAPPDAVIEAAHNLHYRDFLIVGLILDRADTLPDNWIYIHDPEVQVGRIQNFKNWSPAMVPDQNTTSLGMEYFCNESDPLWQMPDQELIALAAREIERLGLATAAEVIDGCVIRQRKAYPVYDMTYRQHVGVIKRYLSGIENLQTIGRNGLHRYNNQDHSMLTGLLATRNLVGEKHNLWDVNTDRSYYETFQVDPKSGQTK